MSGTTGMQSEGDLEGVVRASRVIGSEVRNNEGEKLGKVEDIVLNTNGDILYTVVSYGGFVGIGEKQIAVPLQSFHTEMSGRTMILDISKESMKNVPTYDASKAETADPSWMTNMRDYFTRESSGYRSWNERSAQRAGMQEQQGAIRHASKIIGLDTHNQQNQNIGEVQDLVLDSNQGRILYALVEIEDIPDAEGKYVALPWSSIQVEPQGRVATINADNSTLQALAYDRDNMPNLSSRSFGERVYKQFNQQPYWTTYGFRGEGETPSMKPMKEKSKSGMPSRSMDKDMPEGQ
ncbi:MAG: hypothetical protein A2X46_04305 [Lentisphaerae bacterium GWF2_57_35]|nr:MAG: hypothetical protein A2X46_04305 [Lentisphaerae bacterium GWF2_57_35]